MTIHVGGYHPKIAIMKAAEDRNKRIRKAALENAVKKNLMESYWILRDVLAFEALQSLDHSWKKWFDDDNNVPAYSSSKERAQIVEKHLLEKISEYKPPIAKLYKNVFIWQDRYQYLNNSICVIDKELDFHEFKSMDEAKQFVDRIPSLNIRHGTFVHV